MSRDDPRIPSQDPYLDLEGTLHEISNALTVLLGWVAEARVSDASAEEISRALEIVDKRARRARDLARRAIGAKTIPADAEADVGTLLDDVAASLSVEALRAGVRVARTGPAGGARVALGDDLAQIVTNLALNAFAYAPKGTAVEIACTATVSEITVDVADSGPGVPASRQESIFDGDTQREGGAGVGLRHARALARAAGGDLLLSRESEGGRFRVRWPRSDARRKPTASHRDVAAMPLAGTKILVVEDDADVTDLLEAGLSARGARVTVARTERELDAAVAKEAPDAVLLDLSPIAKDPTGAVARLRRAAPRAAVVLVTGSGDKVPDGVDGVELVRKPFELREIVGALSRARAG